MLLRRGVFAGALFAGALFGVGIEDVSTAQIDSAAPNGQRQLWVVEGKVFDHAGTAIEYAAKIAPRIQKVSKRRIKKSKPVIPTVSYEGVKIELEPLPVSQEFIADYVAAQVQLAEMKAAQIEEERNDMAV